MKTSIYKILDHILSSLSYRFDNPMIVRCKMTVGSSLLLLPGCCYATGSSQDAPKRQNKVSLMVEEKDSIRENNNQVFCYATETMPEFPGGNEKLKQFLISRARSYYPDSLYPLKGRVSVQATVDTFGCFKDIEVIRAVHPTLDSIAIKIIKEMPVWSPGTQRGKRVRVKYTIPIKFDPDQPVNKK